MAPTHSSYATVPGSIPTPRSSSFVPSVADVVPGTEDSALRSPVATVSVTSGASLATGRSRMRQSVNWCFTLNNYGQWDIEQLKAIECKYLVLGYEVAPTTGTPHIQGFIQFNSRKRTTTVGNILPAGCAFYASDGTAFQGADYCRKGGDFYEQGIAPNPPGVAGGLATAEKWEEVWRLAKEGRVEEIPPDIRLRYYSTILRVAKDFMQKPQSLDHVSGTWIYGETGSGKTHAVVTQFPDRYIKPLNKWWDGYQGESIVHLDEICPSHTAWIAPYLKKWADKWPFDAEVKGGALQLRPARIIVTSNYSILEMGFADNDLAAIQRRFVEIKKVREQTIMV